MDNIKRTREKQDSVLSAKLQSIRLASLQPIAINTKQRARRILLPLVGAKMHRIVRQKAIDYQYSRSNPPLLDNGESRKYIMRVLWRTERSWTWLCINKDEMLGIVGKWPGSDMWRVPHITFMQAAWYVHIMLLAWPWYFQSHKKTLKSWKYWCASMSCIHVTVTESVNPIQMKDWCFWTFNLAYSEGGTVQTPADVQINQTSQYARVHCTGKYKRCCTSALCRRHSQCWKSVEVRHPIYRVTKIVVLTINEKRTLASLSW